MAASAWPSFVCRCVHVPWAAELRLGEGLWLVTMVDEAPGEDVACVLRCAAVPLWPALP